MVAQMIASATRRNFLFYAQSWISSSAHTMAEDSVGDNVEREDGHCEESGRSKQKIKEIRGKSRKYNFVGQRSLVVISALAFEPKEKFKL